MRLLRKARSQRAVRTRLRVSCGRRLTQLQAWSQTGRRGKETWLGVAPRKAAARKVATGQGRKEGEECGDAI